MGNGEKPNQPGVEGAQADADAAFTRAVNDSYRTLIKIRLRRNLHERHQRRVFERALYRRHQEALILFDHFIATCNDLGEHVNGTHGPAATDDADSVFFALTRIHARACLTASEIRALIVSGHASGALARWRTLHELAVIAVLIDRSGADAAERYMWSEVVKTAREARKYNKHCEDLGLEPLEPETMEELELRSQYVVQRFGKEMKQDWGWAAPHLRNRPTSSNFKQIEEAVGMQHWQPQVGMANHAVHGGFKGMVTDIGAGGRYSGTILSGPSMYGLVVPADGTLRDLYRCTVTYLLHRPDQSSHVRAAALTQYMMHAQETFVALEQRLTQEEQERGSDGC